jgi:Holliday junction resolvase RusA-like endonuclease
MIYQVNGYNVEPTYFDEATNSNAKADAEALLAQKQKDVLAYEAVRFSICATFVNGNDTVWREVQESDPENTICQVFDTMTGQYTQVANKTEAYALNEQKKLGFLASVGLDKVIELTEMPVKQFYDANRYGQTNGTIPVEKL